MDRELRALGAAVAANLVASLAHVAVHGVAGVPARHWQLAVLGIGLVVAPGAGLRAVRRGRDWPGVALVAGGAALALAMEAPWHFAVPNPDHVAHADAGGAFAATAALSAAGDLLVVAVAAWVLSRSADLRDPANDRRTDRQPDGPPPGNR